MIYSERGENYKENTYLGFFFNLIITITPIGLMNTYLFWILQMLRMPAADTLLSCIVYLELIAESVCACSSLDDIMWK